MTRLRTAVGPTPLGPYSGTSEPFTAKWTEGPSALRIGEEWIAYFDAYRARTYGAAKTRDFRTWIDVSGEMTFPKGHKHGTVLKVDPSIIEGLKKVRR